MQKMSTVIARSIPQKWHKVNCLRMPVQILLLYTIQWNLRIEDALGPSILSFVERLSSFRGYFVQRLNTMVHLVYPLLRGLSSLRVSFIRGFLYVENPISLVAHVCVGFCDV